MIIIHCGVVVGGVQKSIAAWHKVLYVAVHIGYVSMYFDFRPFGSHYEVRPKYFITSNDKDFITIPCLLESLDPHSSLTDVILGSAAQVSSKRVNQKRGTHLKPRIIDLLQKPAASESIELIRYIGLNGDSVYPLRTSSQLRKVPKIHRSKEPLCWISSSYYAVKYLKQL